MTKQEFTGKSLDDALDAAAQTLGVEKSSLSYNILPAAQSGGLLSKLFSRSVRIEAWSDDALNNAARDAVRQVIEKTNKPDTRAQNSENKEENSRREKQKSSQNQRSQDRNERSERSERSEKSSRPQRDARKNERNQRPARAPAAEAEGRPARNPNLPPRVIIPLTNPDVQALFDEYKGMFLKTFEIPTENFSKTADDSGNWSVSIQDSHIENQLAHSDKLAVAFEHIFKRLAQKKVGDVEGRIYLTSGQAEEKREEALKEFAFSLAEKVKKTGRSITVASKTSQERRVIHLTLDGQPGIATRSVGSGDKRRLIVYPTGARPRTNGEAGAENVESGAHAEPNQERNGQRRSRRRGGRGRGRGGKPQNREPSTPAT